MANPTDCEYKGECPITCSHPKNLCRLYERTQSYNESHMLDMNPVEMLWDMVRAGELSELEVETIMGGVR